MISWRFSLASAALFLLLCASANAQQSKAPQAKVAANAPQAAQHNAKAEAAVKESVQAWLAMVDGGKYDQSRNAASEIFKNHWPEDRWTKALEMARTALGKQVSRKFDSSEYLKDPPGSAAGEYVAVRYQTSFEKRKSVTETVIATLEKDGKWRVAVYDLE